MWSPKPLPRLPVVRSLDSSSLNAPAPQGGSSASEPLAASPQSVGVSPDRLGLDPHHPRGGLHRQRCLSPGEDFAPCDLLKFCRSPVKEGAARVCSAYKNLQKLCEPASKSTSFVHKKSALKKITPPLSVSCNSIILLKSGCSFALPSADSLRTGSIHSR